MDSIGINGKEYTVVKLLGHGKGGYSYLVTDGERRFVAKQIHHEKCDYYAFGDKLQAELRDHERLSAVGIPMPRLLDVDVERERLLKEYIDGPTAMELVARDDMTPELTEQVREMCRLLYPAGLNIDYFPTNFILSEGRLWYIDYECNGYMEEWDFEHWGIQYWSKTPAFLECLRNME